MIGSWDENENDTANCFIYDSWSKNWSVKPTSIYMLPLRDGFTAAVLDSGWQDCFAGGITGDGRSRQVLSSTEFIDIDDLLEYAPLHYPLSWLILIEYLMRMKLRAKRLRLSRIQLLNAISANQNYFL